MSIAKTILSQIKMLDRAAMMAWGAKDLTDMGDGLRFKSSGMVTWKGSVYVRYNEGTDLYDIEFFTVRGLKVNQKERVEGIFIDDLVNQIDLVVG